ncbi:MAG: ADP-ribose pyrophosphatase [Labilithrix sp.]|nr:ADP-ribose pyrophosphatase [Labilithrix sp.]
MPFTYPHPRPGLTADVVAFSMRADDLAVLLVKRKAEPFEGRWALPGGFVNENEPLARAAARELREETGISIPPARLEQLGAFGDPGRDPRGHTVTVAFVTFRPTETKVVAGDDAAEAAWHPLRAIDLGSVSQARALKVEAGGPRKRARKLALAFDHAKILTAAYRRICRHLDDPIRDPAFDFVPSRFTLAELKRIYEVVIGTELTTRSVKEHLVDRGLIVPAGAKPPGKAGSQLYRWNKP